MSLPRDAGLRERRELLRDMRHQTENAAERVRPGGDPATSQAAGAPDADTGRWIAFGRVGVDPLIRFRVAL